MTGRFDFLLLEETLARVALVPVVDGADDVREAELVLDGIEELDVDTDADRVLDACVVEGTDEVDDVIGIPGTTRVVVVDGGEVELGVALVDGLPPSKDEISPNIGEDVVVVGTPGGRGVDELATAVVEAEVALVLEGVEVDTDGVVVEENAFVELELERTLDKEDGIGVGLGE